MPLLVLSRPKVVVVVVEPSLITGTSDQLDFHCQPDGPHIRTCNSTTRSNTLAASRWSWNRTRRHSHLPKSPCTLLCDPNHQTIFRTEHIFPRITVVIERTDYLFFYADSIPGIYRDDVPIEKCNIFYITQTFLGTVIPLMRKDIAAS